MKLSNITETDLGRRGFLRGLAGVAVSPGSATKLALGAVVPIVSGIASAISAYRQSGISDEILKQFVKLVSSGYDLPAADYDDTPYVPRPWDLIKTKESGDPSPFGDITPDVITGFLASHGKDFVPTFLNPPANLESFVGDLKGLLRKLPPPQVKEMVKKILSDSDADLLPGRGWFKLAELKEIVPGGVPFTDQEISDALSDEDPALGFKLAQERGFLVSKDAEERHKQWRKEREKIKAYQEKDEQKRRAKKKEQEQEKQEKQEKQKKEMEYEKSAPVMAPITSRPFMLRHPAGPVPSRPAESKTPFGHRLNEKLKLGT